LIRKLSLLGLLLVALSVGFESAQAQSFGDWFAETQSRTALYAASINDSGNVFGQFCFLGEGSCVWLVALKTGCQKGDKYPVLANSDAGAVHLEVYCDGQLESGLYRYAFTTFDPVENLVKQSARIGFALPLQEDEFRVVRFNLRGALAAISAMRAAAESRTKPATRGTRDERM
jgi:hypothetical protein